LKFLFDGESIGKFLLGVKVKATTGYGLAALPRELSQADGVGVTFLRN